MPASLVQQWRGHAVVGNQFQKFLDAFCESYSVVETKATTAETGTPSDPNKRGAEETAGVTPKKPRVTLDSSNIVSTESIEKPLREQGLHVAADPSKQSDCPHQQGAKGMGWE